MKIIKRLQFRLRNFWFQVRKSFAPQVAVIHQKGFNWHIVTRKNAYTREWVYREKVTNKKAEQAIKYAIAVYQGHFLYIPKSKIRKFKNQLKYEAANRN